NYKDDQMLLPSPLFRALADVATGKCMYLM
ncbi:unnamed protein product, partial [marine sediment metagenome]